jgi:EAL domain-containing protein (putative c-di-GMP-specific phosphodiesterase class I)
MSHVLASKLYSSSKGRETHNHIGRCHHDVLTEAILLEAVLSAGLTPDRVVLEITERSVVRLDVVVREASKLRAMGFRLALDDTGAGNAGLEMLSQLPVDFVKIDRAIVVKALNDATARAILMGITTMARQMKSYVIAEGIEDVEMLRLVREVGAQAVQGYLLGPLQGWPEVYCQAEDERQPGRARKHEEEVKAWEDRCQQQCADAQQRGKVPQYERGSHEPGRADRFAGEAGYHTYGNSAEQ